MTPEALETWARLVGAQAWEISQDFSEGWYGALPNDSMIYRAPNRHYLLEVMHRVWTNSGQNNDNDARSA